MANNIWLSRLTLESGGKAGVCSLDVDRSRVKKEVKEYKEDVFPLENDILFEKIDMSDYQEINYSILIKELYEGRLRQGWGWKFEGLSTDLSKNEEDWTINFIKLHFRLFDKDVKCNRACGRYKVLHQMKDMVKGDVIFIPRIPDYGSFSVAKVKTGYSFDSNEKWMSFCHIIDVDNIRSYKYEDHFEGKTFNPYRRAVNKIGTTHMNYPVLDEFLKEHYY
ncbi:hypothetical protein [Methanococcoides sp. AM1]|uniref:hypothetical protein n=1 Tax=Methanococcoides sp. AM1 TaxID=1201011 RepID=UPI00108416D5|nr:hypothetical protein [Methanococcoides sp. AM1]